MEIEKDIATVRFYVGDTANDPSDLQKEWLTECKKDMELESSVNFPPNSQRLFALLLVGIAIGSMVIGAVLYSF